MFTEVELIDNLQPLTVETINDVNSEITLSPSKLLTMKSKVVMPPPGEGELTGTDHAHCGPQVWDPDGSL